MFVKELTLGSRRWKFLIRDAGAEGWEVREEADQQIRTRIYSDWHRVERACLMLERRASSLEREGWVEA